MLVLFAAHLLSPEKVTIRFSDPTAKVVAIAGDLNQWNPQPMKRPFGSKLTDEGHNWTAWRNRMVAGLVYLFGRK